MIFKIPNIPNECEVDSFKIQMGFPGWRIHYYAWTWFRLHLPSWYCGFVVRLKP